MISVGREGSRGRAENRRPRRRAGWVLGRLGLATLGSLCVLVASLSPAGSTSRPGGSREPVGSGVASWHGASASSAALPLDDHRVSTSPTVGYVDSCVTTFAGGAGPNITGPWIDSATGTFDTLTKPHVQGNVIWKRASHSFTVSGGTRTLRTDDLPEGEPTGTFPISSTDPVYRYTRNPNSIEPQDFDWSVPADPGIARSPACAGLGPIGVAMDGVAIFDALDAKGRDADAHEVLDACHGHPQGQGVYHYHAFTPCMTKSTTIKPGESVLVGYALDGFGIYLQRDAHDHLPTDSDLDACHGLVSTVTWNGSPTRMFHYDVTLTYPFTVGCFMGTPTRTATGRPRTAAELQRALTLCGDPPSKGPDDDALALATHGP
ncbi:MAG: YHYH protein [Acidimicrobiales bacterium]